MVRRIFRGLRLLWQYHWFRSLREDFATKEGTAGTISAQIASHRVWVHSPDSVGTDFAPKERTQGGHCRHHMRANSQMKRAGASRYVSASDVRRKIQRRACFRARTVVKSSGLGAQPRRHRDGFRTQGGHCRHHMRANSQMKRAGASRYVSTSDVCRKIQRLACFLLN